MPGSDPRKIAPTEPLPDLKTYIAVFPLREGRICGTEVQRLRFFNMVTSPAINASFLSRDHFFNWISRFLAKPSVGYDSEYTA
jgi:hypothetical protein